MDLKFKPGDTVFAKLQGYPAWPGRVVEIVSDKSPKNIKYRVNFYGTDETAVCKEKELFHYIENREEVLEKWNQNGFNKALKQMDSEVGLKSRMLTPSTSNVERNNPSKGSPHVESKQKEHTTPARVLRPRKCKVTKTVSYRPTEIGLPHTDYTVVLESDSYDTSNEITSVVSRTRKSKSILNTSVSKKKQHRSRPNKDFLEETTVKNISESPTKLPQGGSFDVFQPDKHALSNETSAKPSAVSNKNQPRPIEAALETPSVSNSVSTTKLPQGKSFNLFQPDLHDLSDETSAKPSVVSNKNQPRPIEVAPDQPSVSISVSTTKLPQSESFDVFQPDSHDLPYETNAKPSAISPLKKSKSFASTTVTNRQKQRRPLEEVVEQFKFYYSGAQTKVPPFKSFVVFEPDTHNSFKPSTSQWSKMVKQNSGYVNVDNKEGSYFRLRSPRRKWINKNARVYFREGYSARGSGDRSVVGAESSDIDTVAAALTPEEDASGSNGNLSVSAAFRDGKVRPENKLLKDDKMLKNRAESDVSHEKLVDEISMDDIAQGIKFLRIETRLLYIDDKLKKSVELEEVDPDSCLLYLDELLKINIHPLMIKKHCQIVETVEKLRRYVGNTLSWNLTDEEAQIFAAKTGSIRSKAENVYKKIKSLFMEPPKTFSDIFARKMKEFNDSIKGMDAKEVLALFKDPTEDGNAGNGRRLDVSGNYSKPTTYQST